MFSLINQKIVYGNPDMSKKKFNSHGHDGLHACDSVAEVIYKRQQVKIPVEIYVKIV